MSVVKYSRVDWGAGGRAADGGDLTNALPTYLSTLCHSELDTILTLMSREPCRESWAKDVADSTLYTLLQPGGPLADPCRDLLAVGTHARKFVSTDALVRAAPSLLNVNLTPLIVQRLSNRQLLWEFAGLCVNVEEVTFDDLKRDDVAKWHFYWQILHFVGFKLTNLHLHGYFKGWMTRNVMEACPMLRRLHLLPEYFGNIATGLFWAKIGVTLEELTILYPAYHELDPYVGRREQDEIVNIHRYCRRLTYVFIVAPLVCNAVLASCILSYQHQLKYVLLQQFSPNLVKLILERCPNARAALKLAPNTMHECVAAIGSRLDQIMPRAFHNFPNYPGEYALSPDTANAMKPPFDSCTTVARFSCNMIELVCPFFNTPKPTLTQFHMTAGCGYLNATMMRAATRGTGALTWADLQCAPLDVQLLKNFFAANPELTRLTIEIVNTPGACERGWLSIADMYDYIELIIAALVEFPHIKDVEIVYNNGVSDGKPVDRFTNACLDLRYQRRRLRVNGIDQIRPKKKK